MKPTKCLNTNGLTILMATILKMIDSHNETELRTEPLYTMLKRNNVALRFIRDVAHKQFAYQVDVQDFYPALRMFTRLGFIHDGLQHHHIPATAKHVFFCVHYDTDKLTSNGNLIMMVDTSHNADNTVVTLDAFKEQLRPMAEVNEWNIETPQVELLTIDNWNSI
jgi:hypothetical protein